MILSVHKIRPRACSVGTQAGQVAWPTAIPCSWRTRTNAPHPTSYFQHSLNQRLSYIQFVSKANSAVVSFNCFARIVSSAGNRQALLMWTRLNACGPYFSVFLIRSTRNYKSVPFKFLLSHSYNVTELGFEVWWRNTNIFWNMPRFQRISYGKSLSHTHVEVRH